MQYKDMTTKYADIIHLPHHVSKTRPQMDIIDRAAQFSPFAALTGFEACIEESGRLTEDFVELDEDEIIRINEKIQFLMKQQAQNIQITVVCFEKDEKKQGGKYTEVTGIFKRADSFKQCIVLEDKREILFHKIYDIRW